MFLYSSLSFRSSGDQGYDVPMKEFRLQKFPDGRWGIIMTALTAAGANVDTCYAGSLDEALDWIRERGQHSPEGG